MVLLSFDERAVFWLLSSVCAAWLRWIAGAKSTAQRPCGAFLFVLCSASCVLAEPNCRKVLTEFFHCVCGVPCAEPLCALVGNAMLHGASDRVVVLVAVRLVRITITRQGERDCSAAYHVVYGIVRCTRGTAVTTTEMQCGAFVGDKKKTSSDP